MRALYLVAAGEVEHNVSCGDAEHLERALRDCLNEGGPVRVGNQIVEPAALGKQALAELRRVAQSEARRALLEARSGWLLAQIPAGSPLATEVQAALDVDRELPSLGEKIEPGGRRRFTLGRVVQTTGRFGHGGEGWAYSEWSSEGAKL